MTTVTAQNAFASVVAGGNMENNQIVFNILGKSQEYNALLQQKNEYEQLLTDIPKEKADRIRFYSDKIALVDKEIDSFKTTVIMLAKQFSEIEIDTESVNEARRLFEEGNIAEAQNALKEEDLEDDYAKLLALNEEKQQEIEANRKKITQIAEQFLLKAQIASISYNDEDRVESAVKYYEKALSIQPTISVITEYVRFLRDLNQHQRAIEILNFALQQVNLQPYEKKSYLTILSVAYVDNKELNKGARCIEEAIQIPPDDNEPYLLKIIAHHVDAGTLLFKAGLLFDKKDYKACFETFDIQLKLRRLASENLPERMIPFEIESLSFLASLHLSIGELDKGYEYFNKSMALAIEYFTKPVTLNFNEFPTILVRYFALNLFFLVQHQKLAPEEVDTLTGLTRQMVSEYERIVEESKSRQGYETLGYAFYYLFQVHLQRFDEMDHNYLRKAFDYISLYRNKIQVNDDNSNLQGCINCFIYDYAVAKGTLNTREDKIALLEETVGLFDSIRIPSETISTARNNLQRLIEKVKEEVV
jgi:tetratricopeptide (TPR) repeat protein